MAFYPKSLCRLTGPAIVVLVAMLLHACSSPSPAKVTRTSKSTNTGDATENDKAILVIELSNEAEISSELSGYRLQILRHESPSCSATEPLIDRVGEWKNKNFTIQVPVNCSYFVSLELGVLTGQNTLSSVLYSNVDGGKKGWTVIQSDLSTGGIFKLIRRMSRVGEADPNSSDIGGGPMQDKEVAPTGRKLNLAREVLGYYSNTSLAQGMLSSQASLERDGDLIHILSPLWYTVNAQGMIQADGGGPRNEAIDQVKPKGTKIVPVVRNLGNTNGFLASASLQKKAQDNIVNLISSNKYHGIQIWFTGLSAADKSVMTDFTNGLASRLQSINKMLIVSVPVKEDGGKNLAAAYDFAAIATVADRVVLQGFDSANITTTHGPVSPIAWVKSNVDLAVSSGIPASKLLLGIATYGYEWTKTTTPAAKSLSVSAAQDYIISQDGNLTGTHYRWDDTFSSPVWDFTDRYIYLENAYAAQSKFIYVNDKGLKGAAVWYLGGELPEFWTFLENRFKK